MLILPEENMNPVDVLLWTTAVIWILVAVVFALAIVRAITRR